MASSTGVVPTVIPDASKCDYSWMSQFSIARHNLLETIPRFTKGFEVKYELLLESVTNNAHANPHNVIHLTSGGNYNGKYGERIASVWIYSDLLGFRSAVNGDANYHYNHNIAGVYTCFSQGHISFLMLAFATRCFVSNCIFAVT